MALRGIDISSWQDALVVRDMEGCDLVVVKATGGTGYDSPCLRAHADATLAAGKLLGCYHYARERGYQKDPPNPKARLLSAASPTRAKGYLVLSPTARATIAICPCMIRARVFSRRTLALWLGGYLERELP